MEKNILKLIEALKERSDCYVQNPCGQPLLRDGEALPGDLKLFYENCGGVIFNNTHFNFEIVNPKDMILANPVIVGELCEEDISSDWYIICKDSDNNYLTIDLGKNRLGRCYDSFWDRHGVVGECPIIARNFTELLWNLMYKQEDDSLFWLDDNFVTIGDAYDNL